MTLRIAVVTDIHSGFDSGNKKGSQAPALIEKFIDAAHSFGADYIFNLGDDICSHAPDIDDHHKYSLRQQFSRAACPVIKIDGNHCVRFQAQQSPSDSFDTHGHHIVMWNPYMNRYTQHGVIPDPEDIEWLKDDLSAATKPTIILSHIPFSDEQTINKNWANASDDEPLYYPSHFVNAKNLRDIIETSGKAVMCLSGHRHHNRTLSRQGVHYLTQQSLVQDSGNGQPTGAFTMMEIDHHAAHIHGHGINQPTRILLPFRKPVALP